MVRKLVISAALIALTVGRVSAADGAPAVNTATSQNWTGPYIGGHLGDAWGRSDWTAHENSAAAPPLNGSLDFYQPFDFAKGTGSYLIGLQAGYNYKLPSGVVLGVAADVSFPNTTTGTQTFSSPTLGQATYEEQVEYSGTVRGRLGYALGNWLLYGTAGYAWTDDQLTRTQVAGTPVGGTAVPGTAESRLALRSGWVAGGGVETGIGANWTADLEYLFTDFSSHSVTFPAGAQVFDADLTLQSIRLGLNYQLDGASSKGKDGPAGLTAPNTDNWSVHAQTTYVIQNDPLFRSPYLGTNSLIPGQSRETWDVTFYVGLRLWQGAELWVNPEIDQGFGLSGTLGVAGFPSGEAYKVGDAYPYARVPRYFIRDTIPLGGATTKVDAAANQFAGSQTENRLVLTLGKFAPTDVFDTNKYAHDPRSDWMNWALVDTGTFDYAADAWGYTYGAALEWYQGPWTLRAGLFDLSIVPNSTELDPTFSQFQSVLELERRYNLWGQPGKTAVTGFLSRGRMGTFNAAVQLAEVTNQPADIAAVREYRSRPGISLNVEQQLNPDLGMFVRAGLADGEVEPYEFTDVDRTLAAGLVQSGKPWGRPDDVIGVGGIINGITGPHEAFLNAGGLGILVGDGKLPKPGLEEIIETYYGLPIERIRATVDYQFINNPAYNEQRGPVSVIGGRLHAQF
jgi:high affinity Mn2+ porin